MLWPLCQLHEAAQWIADAKDAQGIPVGGNIDRDHRHFRAQIGARNSGLRKASGRYGFQVSVQIRRTPTCRLTLYRFNSPSSLASRESSCIMYTSCRVTFACTASMSSSGSPLPAGEGGPIGPGEGFGRISSAAPPHPVTPRPPSPTPSCYLGGEGITHTKTLRDLPARSYERSGRRKALPKLKVRALRRPVAAVLDFQASALRLDEPLKRPRGMLPVTPRCQDGP